MPLMAQFSFTTPKELSQSSKRGWGWEVGGTGLRHTFWCKHETGWYWILFPGCFCDEEVLPPIQLFHLSKIWEEGQRIPTSYCYEELLLETQVLSLPGCLTLQKWGRIQQKKKWIGLVKKINKATVTPRGTRVAWTRNTWSNQRTLLPVCAWL